jgi:hypothetical protein
MLMRFNSNHTSGKKSEEDMAQTSLLNAARQPFSPKKSENLLAVN